MDLKDFISTTLQQVISGVGAAQAQLGEKGKLVNAPGRGSPTGRTEGGSPIQNVDFDVAVTVTEEAGLSGGISVLGLGLGVKGGTTDTSSKVSRIRFTVPVALPIKFS